MRRCNFRLCVKLHACTFSHTAMLARNKHSAYKILWLCYGHQAYILCCSLLESLFPSLLFSQLCHTCLTPTPPTTPPHPPLLHCHSITHTTLVTQVHTVTWVQTALPHLRTPSQPLPTKPGGRVRDVYHVTRTQFDPHTPP